MLPQEESLIERGAVQCRKFTRKPQSSYNPTQYSSAEQLIFATSRSENVLLFPFLSQWVLVFLEYTTSSKNGGQRQVEYKFGPNTRENIK